MERVSAESEGREAAYQQSSEGDYAATVAKDLIKNVLKRKDDDKS
jgi:hypothetical protein